LSRSSVDDSSISRTFSEVATIAGASVLEKRYGRDRWRRISTISFLPVVYPPEAPPRAIFVGAPAVLADKADRVGVIDHYEGVILLGEVADCVELCDCPVHREDAVGRDHAEAGGLGLLELLFEVAHIAVAEAETLRLAQADAVDDAGVVELVGDYCVLCREQGLEEARVGVEARAVEDGVFGAEEFGDLLFELLVNLLCAADEADGREAVAPFLVALACGLDNLGVVGQAEIVVGAEVEDLLPAGDRDVGLLRTCYDTLGLVQPVLPDLLKLTRYVGFHCAKHFFPL